MTFVVSVAVSLSVLLNIFLAWYVIRLVHKFYYISESFSDLFLTFKSFEAFVKSIYKMEILYGEPVIQDLIGRTKIVIEEIEIFRDVFEYTLDEDLEEEINDIAQEAEIETH